MRSGLIAAMVAVGAAFSAPTHATVIDFNSLGGSVLADGDGASFTTAGYKFLLNENVPQAFLIGVLGSSSTVINNGTANLSAANHATIILSEASSAPFSLEAFDLGGSFISSPGRWASGLDVVGALALGGTVSFFVELPSSPASLFTVELPDTFAGLSSVTFSPRVNQGSISPFDYEYALDDIHVELSAVPEPTTVFLLGTALMGFVITRRRRGAL
jgi:hypothetical protein